MDRRSRADLCLCLGVVWKDLRAGRGLSVLEPGRKPVAGSKLGMASRMAIGEREPDLDWSGNRRAVARPARKACRTADGGNRLITVALLRRRSLWRGHVRVDGAAWGILTTASMRQLKISQDTVLDTILG